MPLLPIIKKLICHKTAGVCPAIGPFGDGIEDHRGHVIMMDSGVFLNLAALDDKDAVHMDAVCFVVEIAQFIIACLAVLSWRDMVAYQNNQTLFIKFKQAADIIRHGFGPIKKLIG